MMRRLLSSLVFVAMLTSPALGKELQGTLKKIKETGTITIGFREASRPFSFLDGDGKPAGYSIDLCTRIANAAQQELGLSDLKIKWVPVTPENRIAMVVQDTVDIECGSTTNTLSRQEEVDFSILTFVDGGSLLVKAGSGIAGLGDLGGKRVAVARGTTTERTLAEALKKAFISAQIVPVKDHGDGLAALEGGTADAYASDRVILVGLALTAKEPKTLALAEHFFSYEPYGFMLRRGDAAFRLTVNRTLARLYRSDQLKQIWDKWFGRLGRPSGLIAAMYAIEALPE